MAEASIPVDLFNPGQVFACIGFAEAADTLLGNAEGAFDWSDRSQARFWLRARGKESPIGRVLRFIDSSRVFAEVPRGSANLAAWKSAWGAAPVEVDRSHGYPLPDPSSPATLICVLTDGTGRLTIDHWGDGTSRDNVKFWAGSGGYPGAGLARDAVALTRGRALAAVTNPFDLAAPQSSSFRLDWRRDYIPIDAGFSLNAHGNMETMGFPVVELLGAIGLAHARPARLSPRNKLDYVYGVAGGDIIDAPEWLPTTFHRAALGGSTLPFPTRRFRMLLNWPGQEGQARSITTVTEETSR